LLIEDKIIFTCDSFGAHYCSDKMYSDFTDAYTKAFKYYFDVILKPFSRFMIRAIDKIKPLDIDFICPGHGPIHHKNIDKAIDLSEKYADSYMQLVAGKDQRNILIAYVSAYGYTKEAAGQIAEGILETEDINVDLTDIENISLDELESKIILADAILIGSPTINQNTLMPVYKLFALINPIRDRGKYGGAFGSYGWSGESPRIILENLRLLKLKIFEDTATFLFSPEGSKEDLLRAFGRQFAKKFLEECVQIKNPGN